MNCGSANGVGAVNCTASDLSAVNAAPPTGAVERARAEYRARRRRNALFGTDRFGEPTWDMLLDLFIAAGERREVRVSSACIAAAVPTSTALRHLGYLVSDGLVLRRPHPTDSRSAIIELAPETMDLLLAYFGSAETAVARDASRIGAATLGGCSSQTRP